MDVAVPDTVHRVDLPEVLSIREVDDFKALLLDAVAHPEPVALHAETLVRIDTAGLQLLAALVRDRHQEGRVSYWASHSEALNIAAERLGLSALLGLSQDHQF
jgi:anti-anti-sigma regulatory factor